jgi:uncharacterized membrane protein YkoI
MKKLILGVMVLISTMAISQTEASSKNLKVPTEVKLAFKNEFPEAKAHWGTEDGGYEAEFKINGNDASAVYDRKGHRTALEVAITIEDVPTKAREYLLKNYPTNKITETAKITNDKNEITYEAEIGKDGKFYDVLFDAKGSFLRIVAGD